MTSQPLRVGINGSVGSGKITLTLTLCHELRERYNLAVVTDDIYTQEDAGFLACNEALTPEWIIGTETGDCLRTAIREDASINLKVVDQLNRRFPGLELILVKSGGDNLPTTFSPELSGLTLYVIDVSVGDKIPRKSDFSIYKSDLLVTNKTGLAPLIGTSFNVVSRDVRHMCGDRPFVFNNQKTGQGLDEIIASIKRQGPLIAARRHSATTRNRQ